MVAKPLCKHKLLQSAHNSKDYECRLEVFYKSLDARNHT